LLRLHIDTLLRFRNCSPEPWLRDVIDPVGLDRSAIHLCEPLRRRLPGGTVLVFADPTGLGFPIFPLQRAEFILTDPFFVGPLLTAFVGPDRLNRLCFRCLHNSHTTGRSFDSLS
jgi:hypothetical protein